ncbi:MAG: alpha/beta hydrolase [Pseudomonadota bacterium]
MVLDTTGAAAPVSAETAQDASKRDGADKAAADQKSVPAPGEAAGNVSASAAAEKPIDRPQDGVHGTVILLNGRTEFIEKYGEVIGELLDRRFFVAALDWRGQGGSERVVKGNRLKGHIDDMDSYVEDLTALLEFLDTTNCPRPFFCLAHSTGGQVLLRAAPLVQDRIQRAVTTAPFLDLVPVKMSVATIYRLVAFFTYAGLGELYAPTVSSKPPTSEAFEGNALTSDPARFARNRTLIEAHPELAIGGPTIAWVYAALTSARAIQERGHVSRISLPILMLSASEDRIVSSRAVERVAGLIRTAAHLSVPGARHEILMERDALRAQFWAAFDAFIPGSQ